jgi:hypothetical protein
MRRSIVVWIVRPPDLDELLALGDRVAQRLVV